MPPSVVASRDWERPVRRWSTARRVEDESGVLMEGLRTTLPGVQLVTVFLLTVPMYEKYEQFTHSERVAYFIAFSTCAAASLLLTAPSSHQRLRSNDEAWPGATGATSTSPCASRSSARCCRGGDHRGRVPRVVDRARHRLVASRSPRRSRSRGCGAGTTCRSCRSGATATSGRCRTPAQAGAWARRSSTTAVSSRTPSGALVDGRAVLVAGGDPDLAALHLEHAAGHVGRLRRRQPRDERRHVLGRHGVEGAALDLGHHLGEHALRSCACGRRGTARWR